METEITIVGNGANGVIRIAVLLPDSARDAECYTHYHSGYYIAEETRERLSEALLANYGGYRLGNVINRDYGEGYTIYTVEITPKIPLETRGKATGYFPLANIGGRRKRRLRHVSGNTPILPFPACRVARGLVKTTKQ